MRTIQVFWLFIRAISLLIGVVVMTPLMYAIGRLPEFYLVCENLLASMQDELEDLKGSRK